MEPNQAGMLYYNYNPVDGTLTSASSVQIEFGSEEVAKQINQQVQLQYSTQGIQPGQTQQIVITTQPTFDTTEDIDPLLIKGNKTKIRSNGERVPCQMCGKTFSCNANLRDHLRLHTGERPFQCSECGMSFAQRSNWRLHKRVHTGERPYMCGICGKTFARSSHLPGHIRVHTGERPFQCVGCQQSFSSPQALKNHMRTHTGDKPFKCEACLTTFTHSSTLSSHRKRCTGEMRKRGRPIGSGRRKKRSLNRPRGRPKKGRFGRRRKKIEEIPSDDNIKEEISTENTENNFCKGVETEVNDDDQPPIVDIAVSVLNSIPGKHDIEEPLMCNVTETDSGETLLCKITDTVGEDAVLCNITGTSNGEMLFCNVGETNNTEVVLAAMPEEQDVKPILGHDVIKVSTEAADLANTVNLKSNVSALSDSSYLQQDISDMPYSNDQKYDLQTDLSRLPDSRDLRQEAAVAMTTLQHSIINNVTTDGHQQTF